jgi:CelD/BcsL family acetyltransferase involved in cellulose biosynthesis
MIEVKHIDNFNNVSHLAEEWDSLLQNSFSPNIFLTFEWFKTYCNHYKPENILFILVYDDSELVGIAPLQIIELKYLNFFKIRKVVFISERFSEYCDFIIKKGREKEIFPIFLTEIKKYKFDWIDLLDISENSITPAFINTITKDKKILNFSCKINDHNIYYHIDTSFPKEKYLYKFSSKTINTLERKIKKFENDFSVKLISEYSADAEGLSRLSDFNITRMNKKQTNSFFENHENSLFINDLITEFSRKGYILISKIHLYKLFPSIFLCFLFNNKLSYFLSGYDPEFEKYSIGAIHLKYLIDFSFENKFSSFDFLRGDDEYKKRWHPEKSYSKRIILVPDKFGKKSLKILFNVFSFINNLFQIKK